MLIRTIFLIAILSLLSVTLIAHAETEDPIGFDELNFEGYINEQDTRLHGVEFEYLKRHGNHLKIGTGLSYVNARFRSSEAKLPGDAEWLANLELPWKPVIDWTGSIQLHHVNEQHGPYLDSRSHLATSASLDITASYLSSTPGLQLYPGVKNLTNEDIRYPQQLTTDFTGGAFIPYPDDYPRPGRRSRLLLSYDI
ncbi:MAG: TonB-dependent receptor [Candidatus Thiodiazotropha sp. (ex Codakia rugifera)]|nr:TonB-dependent receptor [Candidatus Thiodiazotropha sp. (ex Codakia rugifera)]